MPIAPAPPELPALPPPLTFDQEVNKLKEEGNACFLSGQLVRAACGCGCGCWSGSVVRGRGRGRGWVWDWSVCVGGWA
jgi:hypothetical protein